MCANGGENGVDDDVLQLKMPQFKHELEQSHPYNRGRRRG